MVVLGQESTIKLGGQFASDLHSATGLDPDSHIQAVLQSRGRVGDGATLGLIGLCAEHKEDPVTSHRGTGIKRDSALS